MAECGGRSFKTFQIFPNFTQNRQKIILGLAFMFKCLNELEGKKPALHSNIVFVQDLQLKRVHNNNSCLCSDSRQPPHYVSHKQIHRPCSSSLYSVNWPCSSSPIV